LTTAPTFHNFCRNVLTSALATSGTAAIASRCRGTQDAQLLVEQWQWQGQESGIGDNASAGQIDGDLLPFQFPEGKS
jgi:hypothetical protein